MAKICPKCGYYNSNIRKTCALCDTALNGEYNQKYIPKRVSFYDIKRKNTINSILLVFAIIIVLSILGFFVGEYFGFDYWGIVIAFFISLISSLTAYYKGKDIVLKISGAKRANDKDKMIINIVEEISIAAGIKVPEVYIIETEAMNAFATGRDPEHSAIALTRGLINRLNREELSGVIAHEMSHIKHFDIRFSMLIGVLVGTVIIISDFILRYFFFVGGRRRRKSKNSGGGIILLILLILAILSPLLAKLIQMAASRKREILADAGAAEITRNPEALANALEKIALSPVKLKASKATQHMYIVNPLKNFSEKSRSLFSTHPPIKSRIKLLRSM